MSTAAAIPPGYLAPPAERVADWLRQLAVFTLIATIVVPIAWKPGRVADSAPPVSDDKDEWLLRLLGSDFLYWAGLRVAHQWINPAGDEGVFLAERRASPGR